MPQDWNEVVRKALCGIDRQWFLASIRGRARADVGRRLMESVAQGTAIGSPRLAPVDPPSRPEVTKEVS